MIKRKTSPKDRFWLYVNPEPNSGCWLWDGYLGSDGYGYLGRGGRGAGNIGAHRVSWEIHNGPIPNEMFVLHKCDIKPCVNPDHLFLGYQKDNIKDMMIKGRHLNGLARRSKRMKGIIPPQFIGIKSQRKRDKCKRGHDFSNPENIMIQSTDGHRRCKICRKIGRERRKRRS